MRRVSMEPPEVCEQCGGDAFRPASRREQLARWFIHGAGSGTAWHCRNCGASWSGGSSYTLLYSTSDTGWQRLRLPLDVLQALRDHRRWHPVPVFYAGVGGLALLPAAAVAVLTRMRTATAILGIPAAAMVGAFLWSLASGRGDAWQAVQRQLAPHRAWRRETEEEIAAVKQQVHGFPLLMPERWPGALSVEPGSWSVPPRGPRELRELAVVADQGDPLLEPDRDAPGWRPPTPRVEVRLTREPWGFPEEVALHEFVHRAFTPVPPDLDDVDGSDPDELDRRLLAAFREHRAERDRHEEEAADRWRDGTIRVGGAATPARILTGDDSHVAVATFVHDGQAVLVVTEGVTLDELALVPVADPDPLIEEFEVRRRRMFAQVAG